MNCPKCMVKDKTVELEPKMYIYAVSEAESTIEERGYIGTYLIYFKCPLCKTLYERGDFTHRLIPIPKKLIEWLRIRERTIK